MIVESRTSNMRCRLLDMNLIWIIWISINMLSSRWSVLRMSPSPHFWNLSTYSSIYYTRTAHTQHLNRPLNSEQLQPEVLQLSISSMTLGRNTMLEIATGISSDPSASCNFLNYPHIRNLIWSSSYISMSIDPYKSYIKLLRYPVKRFATIKNRFWISEFEDSLTIGEQTSLSVISIGEYILSTSIIWIQ